MALERWSLAKFVPVGRTPPPTEPEFDLTGEVGVEGVTDGALCAATSSLGSRSTVFSYDSATYPTQKSLRHNGHFRCNLPLPILLMGKLPRLMIAGPLHSGHSMLWVRLIPPVGNELRDGGGTRPLACASPLLILLPCCSDDRSLRRLHVLASRGSDCGVRIDNL